MQFTVRKQDGRKKNEQKRSIAPGYNFCSYLHLLIEASRSTWLKMTADLFNWSTHSSYQVTNATNELVCIHSLAVARITFYTAPANRSDFLALRITARRGTGERLAFLKLQFCKGQWLFRATSALSCKIILALVMSTIC